MSQESLRIRRAHQSDLPRLLDLYQHLAAGDARPALDHAERVFDQFMAYGGSAIFVGEIGEDLASSCSLVVVPNLTRGGRPYGLIENVVTHSDFRKRGFGSQLLSAASDAAWQANCYKVMLMTGSKRPETLNFYLRAGFEQSKTGFQKRRFESQNSCLFSGNIACWNRARNRIANVGGKSPLEASDFCDSVSLLVTFGCALK